jgi:hypothetical protein
MYWGRLLISIGALCGALSTMQAQVTVIPSSFTSTHVFPPVGLGSTETASITVVNTATAESVTATTGTSTIPPGTSTTPASCTGTIAFFNSSGQMIGTATSFTVGSQQFKTVTLPFANAGLSGSSLANGNRGEIQGQVSVTTSTSTYAPCSLLLSMETYDSTTGATHAVLTSSPVLPLIAFPGGPAEPVSGTSGVPGASPTAQGGR